MRSDVNLGAVGLDSDEASHGVKREQKGNGKVQVAKSLAAHGRVRTKQSR